VVEKRTGPAEPVTAVIADRVRALRERAGLNQAQLATRMAELGLPWTRLTVVNLEKRASQSRSRDGKGRDSVSVQELMALALALDVPPLLLIADPRSDDPVPIATGVKRRDETTWDALLWLVGQNDIAIEFDDDEPPSDRYSTRAAMIWAAWEIAEAVTNLQNPAHRWLGYDPVTDREYIEEAEAKKHRLEVHRIERAISMLERYRVPAPPLPPAVLKRAKEIGLDEFAEQHGG
jgi:transcriptional regulator with XRE-family HTH domain